MKILKNITTVFLSLLICYTSSGANLAVHFCGGKISRIAFSEHDANCGMEKSVCNYALSNNYRHGLENADTCCKNQLLKNKTKFQTINQNDFSELAPNSFLVSLLLPQIVSNLFVIEPTDSEDISPHVQWLSSLTKRKVYLLCQNFRI